MDQARGKAADLTQVRFLSKEDAEKTMQAGNAGTHTPSNLWSERTWDRMCPSICVLPNADQPLSYVSRDHGYILISMAIMFPLSPNYCK